MNKNSLEKIHTSNLFCLYYVAKVKRELCWVLSSALRGTENVAFDRALDKTESTFEFFVPHDMQKTFLEVMNYLTKQEVIIWLEERENRLISQEV